MNCDKLYIPVKKIGQGYSGNIWLCCKNDIDCNYIMKVIFFINGQKDEESFLNEVNTMKIFSPLNVCPKLYDYSICSTENKNETDIPLYKYLKQNYEEIDNIRYGKIIMEKMDGDLTDLIKLNKFKGNIAKQATEELIEKYKIIENRGYVHTDIHDGNILYKIDRNQDLRWYFGDMDIPTISSYLTKVEELNKKIEQKKKLGNVIYRNVKIVPAMEKLRNEGIPVLIDVLNSAENRISTRP